MTGAIRQTIGLPPDDTLQFFRAKGYLPADYREDWDAIWQEEHARWFTVTKVFNNSALEDIRRSLDQAIAEGATWKDWKEAIRSKLAGQDGVDPRLLTSEARLRIVFDTNLRMSRAAGQWKRIQSLKHVMPYLRYSAVNDTRSRPLHRLWGGLDNGKAVILPVDHPWWDTHFPPCGWNCRCGVRQLSERDMERDGLSVYGPPPEAPASRYVRSNGAIETVPAGIDPGFAYNPGKSYLRALAPVPEDGPIGQPRIVDPAMPRPELPAPRAVRTEDLLPDDVTPEDAATRFLAVFGATQVKSKVFIDEVGEPVAIDWSMFTYGDGRLKAGKLGRARYALLVARALREPDEIWYEWLLPDPTKEAASGKRFMPRIRRRYVARFLIDGVEKAVFAALDLGSSGWSGKTWFSPDDGVDYLDRAVRRATLVYRRNSEGSGQ